MPTERYIITLEAREDVPTHVTETLLKSILADFMTIVDVEYDAE